MTMELLWCGPIKPTLLMVQRHNHQQRRCDSFAAFLVTLVFLQMVCQSYQDVMISNKDGRIIHEDEELDEDDDIILLEGVTEREMTEDFYEDEDGDYDDVILRPEDLRQSFALTSAIQLYNVTQDFADKMKLAFKHDHYEDILKKEGVALKKEMDYLEKQYIQVLQQIDASGGIKPKKENDTTEMEKFALKMAVKYDAMVQSTKAFTEKLLKALAGVKKDKAGILDELHKFTRYKKQYEDTRAILESSGLFLRYPNKDAEPVEQVDLNILTSLLKYYKQIDTFDDEIVPILNKYGGSIDKMDKLTADYLIVEEGLLKVKKMEVMIKHVVKQNDNMLRHFEGITNTGIARAQEAIPEMASMYEGLQNRIMEITKELGAQDVRIRDLHNKLNEYFKKANEEAIFQAVKENPGKVRMKAMTFKNEEELQDFLKREGMDPMRVKVTEEGLKQFMKQEGIHVPKHTGTSDEDNEDDDDDDDIRDEL